MKYFQKITTNSNFSETSLKIYILLLILSSITISCQNIRFTVSGRKCIFPAKHNGVQYNNCILNEKGQEWCYFDKLGISWDYCARGDFKIESSLLMKNIDSLDNETEYCLFNFQKEEKIYALKCDSLLLIKKLKLEESLGIDTNSFEFFWINGSQIKTKIEEKCLHPVETPVISNNKISYFGYVQSKRCVINDDLTINNEQKWKIDESGRIINENIRKCMVRSEEKIKISNMVNLKNNFKQSRMKNNNLDKNINLENSDFDVHTINLGDCIGNIKGYQGREIFILEEFRPEILELIALNKLTNVYNTGRDELDKIITKSNEKFIKLINFNSKLIDHKRTIDDTESKLESAEGNLEKDLEKFNFDKSLNKLNDNNNFNLHGVILQGYKNINIENNQEANFSNPDLRMIINSINIKNSVISSFNFLETFNNIEDKFDHKSKITEDIKIIKLNAFFIYREEKSENEIYKINKDLPIIKIKIETNANFQIIMNSKIILENREIKNNNNIILNTENLKINFHSLNDIQIILENRNELNFNISIIKQNDLKYLEISYTDFIPMMPNETFCLNKKEFMNNLEYLDCSKNIKSIDITKNKFYFCNDKCEESNSSEGICHEALSKGIIPNKGGLIYFSDKGLNLKTKKYDFSQLGLDEMITEVKLGYIEDFKKYTIEASESIYKNYKLTLNVKDNNLDNSFLFYKKKIISNGEEYVLIDVKLICDNGEDNKKNNEENNLSEKDLTENNKVITKEKIHDMINGFTIWLYKIKYSDYVSSQIINQIEDLKIDIIHSNDEFKTDFEEKLYSDLDYNKFVCSINNKSILLRTKFNTINRIRPNNMPLSNIPDYHADIDTTIDEVLNYSSKINMKELVIRCNITENKAKVEDMKSNMLCDKAIEKGFITKLGGIFKIKIEDDKKLIFYDIKDLPCLKVINNENFKIYTNSEEILDIAIKGFLTENQQNKNISNFSSFLETEVMITKISPSPLSNNSNSNSNKFYSNDLLVKIEQGLNRVTDKIIDGSKRISEVKKINEDLNKKFERLEKGENSIEVISKRVNEISKLETNLEERVNSKFHKYHKIIKEKEAKIKEVQGNRNNIDDLTSKFDYDLKTRYSDFFNDWIIIDALGSKNGPSDWNIKTNEINNEKALTQFSSIYDTTGSKLEKASTLILKNVISKKNLYSFIAFTSKSFGSLQINFRYVNYKNYLSLQLIKKSKDSGSVKLLKISEGVVNELADLPCENMMSIMKKCFGYITEENGDDTDKTLNQIEIFNYGDNIQIVFNNRIIFKIKEKDIEKFNKKAKFSISINNQVGISISKLIVREMNFEEVLRIKNITETKINNKDSLKFSVKRDGENNFTTYSRNEVVKDKIINADTEQINTNLKYNPSTNNFEIIKSNNSDNLINKNTIFSNSKNSKSLPVPLALMNKFRHNYIKEKCLKYENEEYVCNYISNVISKNYIEIHSSSPEDLIKLIRGDCTTTMKNKFICDQILIKLEPVKLSYNYFRLLKN